MVLGGGGGRGGRVNSKLCAFLKRGRNATFECLGYPRGQRKTSMFSFYATIAIGQFFPVILAFPR